MGRKALKKKEDVEAYRHEADTRKDAVSIGLASSSIKKLDKADKETLLLLLSGKGKEIAKSDSAFG